MFGRKTAVPSIGVRKAAAGVLTGELQLVDVRDVPELAEARVDGALHIPLGDLHGRLAELDRGRPVGFLCRSGARSAMATRSALSAGFDALNVDGGVIAWVRAGLPLRSNSKEAA